MDRFLMRISMGSLSETQERQMIDRYINDQPLETIDLKDESALFLIEIRKAGHVAGQQVRCELNPSERELHGAGQ